MNDVSFFVGYVALRSALTLEEVGDVLSQRIFVGLKFGGKDLEIHEEIPAIFIQESIMGLKVVLDGYSGTDEGRWFTLSGSPNGSIEYDKVQTRLDNYLYQLLKKELAEVKEIEVLVPE